MGSSLASKADPRHVQLMKRAVGMQGLGPVSRDQTRWWRDREGRRRADDANRQLPTSPVGERELDVPTLEFFGYVEEQRRELERRIRMRLRDEPYRRDCVFVTSSTTKVLDWEGREQPFVRVSTRSEERAERFKVLFGDLCDLEVVRIQFQPMGASDGEAPA